MCQQLLWFLHIHKPTLNDYYHGYIRSVDLICPGLVHCCKMLYQYLAMRNLSLSDSFNKFDTEHLDMGYMDVEPNLWREQDYLTINSKVAKVRGCFLKLVHNCDSHSEAS